MSWRGYPVFGLFLFTLAFLSLAPIITAINQGLWAEAKAFGYAFVFTSIAALLLTLAYQGRVSPAEARAEFLTLAGVLIVGPGLPHYRSISPSRKRLMRPSISRWCQR